MRGQKAPSAKRCIKTLDSLRRRLDDKVGQKAPSAKRCIKTHALTCSKFLYSSQKAPSAKRCIKTRWIGFRSVVLPRGPESTERQTVH